MPEDGQISTIGTREVDGTSFTARAMLLGERFDTRALESDAKILATTPLLLGIGGGGTAVLFRYGVVTLFGVEGESVPEFLRSIESFVSEPFAVPEQEETQLAIRAGIDQPTVDSTGTIRAAG